MFECVVANDSFLLNVFPFNVSVVRVFPDLFAPQLLMESTMSDVHFATG